MEFREIITGVLLVAGCFFILVSALGMVRFPDFYSRMHPAGKSDTLGQGLVLLGLMVYEGITFVTIKLFIILVFIFLINPTATHALAKAAYISGLRPWRRGAGDDDDETSGATGEGPE